MINKSKILICVIIAIIVILLGIGTYFLLNNKDTIITSGNASKSIKKEVITAENYQEISDKISEQLKDDDELYYMSYSVMYYMFEDGMKSAFTNPDDESAIYKRIYGKTVQQLIDEGKELMKENDMTIEKFKEELQKMATTD